MDKVNRLSHTVNGLRKTPSIAQGSRGLADIRLVKTSLNHGLYDDGIVSGYLYV